MNNLAYTEGSKNLGSPRPVRRFFVPSLRLIAKAVEHSITGMRVTVTSLLSETVRHPHLNGWICKSKNLGGLK